MPNFKAVLYHVAGVQVHEYMGKIGNYQGPEIYKILQNVNKLEEHMNQDPALMLYFHTFVAFKDVASSVFGTELGVRWRECLHIIRSWIRWLRTILGMPVTPKIYILVTHLE